MILRDHSNRNQTISIEHKYYNFLQFPINDHKAQFGYKTVLKVMIL